MNTPDVSAPDAPAVTEAVRATTTATSSRLQLAGTETESSRRVPLMRELLALHKAGEIEPAPITLGPMPASATAPMLAIAADMTIRFGLMVPEGLTRALGYATSEATSAGIVRGKGSASYALGRLCDSGVIRCVGEMPKLGRGNGTKLYVPPDWWPDDPIARAVVEETGRHDQASELVWVPDSTSTEGDDDGRA